MSFLAADFTWFDWVPGYKGLNESLAHMLGTSLMGVEVHSVTHIVLTIVACAIILGLVFRARGAWSASGKPELAVPGFGARNFVEMLLDTVLSFAEQVFGNKKDARTYLPLIGTLAFYILVNNFLGLVPGFLPATDNLNVTVGPAIIVFMVTHIMGIKKNGLHYLEHFLGPKFKIFGMNIPLLAPLMVPIEIISHVARPLSLSLRLMGNMTGDHAVLAIFLSLVAIPLLFPLPILVLGSIVCTVQTLVFCMLSMVYIALAIEHSEEAH